MEKYFYILSTTGFFKLKFLTVFLCSLYMRGTLRSITNRSEGQHLKLVLCVLIKASDILCMDRPIRNSNYV